MGFWSDKEHHLDRMSMRELVVAYFQYPAIQSYLLIAAVGIMYLLQQSLSVWRILMVVVAVVVVYPLIWYVLHRFVLHGSLYKHPQFAKVWKRIHYDHHRDPNNLNVLFGALHTTLPTIMAFTLPIGAWIHGISGSVAGLVTGVFVTMFYEFCHCIQHLHYTPKYKFLVDMKRLHLLHHFRNEKGNYGITNFVIDHALNTFYDKDDGREKSATVFNLGYDEQEQCRYPWVAELSERNLTD